MSKESKQIKERTTKGRQAMKSAPVDQIRVSAYSIPLEKAESDAVSTWSTTTMILVESRAGGETGIGYTYSHSACAQIIEDVLAPVILGYDAMSVSSAWDGMMKTIGNSGPTGITAEAASAVDVSLMDLKSKLLGVPLVDLLGMSNEGIPVYASGGFKNYSSGELQEQLQSWVESGFGAVKMKVGANRHEDERRVAAAREAIGVEASLFVDASGSYSKKEASLMAEIFADHGVTWFEEPLPPDDTEALRMLSNSVPPGMDIVSGRHATNTRQFRKILEAQAVDVLEADATKCGGITGFMRAGALAEAFNIQLSPHAAPTIHLPLACALSNVRHLEYFHDHVMVERLLFDGFTEPDEDGMLRPDLSRPGLGVEFKHSEAKKFLTHRKESKPLAA